MDRICRIEGIDGIWIGPSDLAQSLGHPGKVQHPDVLASIDKVIDTANHHGRPWSIPARSIKEYKKHVSRGATLMTLGSDTRMVMTAATTLVTSARAVLERKGLRK